MTERQQVVPAWVGRRIIREREKRKLSMRQLAAKAGVSASTVMRAELGCDIALSTAFARASVLDTSAGALLAEPVCATCDGIPPEGFTCNDCGRGDTP